LRKLKTTKQAPDPFERDVHCLLGLPFDAVSETGALNVLEQSIAKRQRCFLSTPNLNWIVACLRDKALRESVLDSNLSVPDGMPIVWIARLLRIPLCQRIAGSGLMEMLTQHQSQRTSVYFFGGPEGVAEQACRQLNSANGPMRCSGYESPGFGDVASMSSDQTLDRINSSNSDFLVVSLGAKKGQAWIQRNLHALDVPVISHLGAVINFIAGTVERAPLWMQRSGLEWLWRIHQEPALWRRYFYDGLVFLRLLLTRVAPLALHVRLMTTPPGSSPPAFTLNRKDNQTEVSISGNWRQADLPPLRACLREACRSGKTINLKLEGVTEIDSALVGLLLLLENECRRQSITLKFLGVTPRTKRLLRYFCAEYLLEQH